MSRPRPPFCGCESEADCAARQTGLAFEMCRGTRRDMPADRQWAYRESFFAVIGLDAVTATAVCSDCAPPLTLGGVISGAVGTAKAVLGIGVSSREELERRYSICQACRRNDLGQCLDCGCYVAVKARVASESCEHWVDASRLTASR